MDQFLRAAFQIGFLEIWLPPVSTSSLSLSPSPSLSFSGRIPIWSVVAHHVYLFEVSFKTHVRGSPRQGILCYSSGHRWPNVNGGNLLS